MKALIRGRIDEIRRTIQSVEQDISDGYSASGDYHLQTLLNTLYDEIMFLHKIIKTLENN